MEIRPILSALLRNKTGPILVAVQVALSLAILANALHIVQVRQAVSARASGVANEQEVFALQVRHLKVGGHEDQLAVQRAEAATLRAVPGVLSVAGANQMPLSRSGNYSSLSTDRKQVKSAASTTNYFSPDSLIKTWGLKLVEGRDFVAGDVLELDETISNEFPKTAIVTRALAEKLWPGQSRFVGKTLYYGVGNDSRGLQVVGVIDRLQTPNAEIKEGGEFSTLLPLRRTGGSDPNNSTRRAEPGQIDRVVKEAEAAVRAASATPVIVRIKTLAEMRTARYRADNALAWMLVTVSVLLLLITSSGIVGMASLWVTQRRKQIGVRRALGARRIDILRYFVTENIMITSAGVAAGVLLALGLNQLLVSKLEMARLPSGYLLAGAGVFLALGVGAVYGPAWRAATISPATATRSA